MSNSHRLVTHLVTLILYLNIKTVKNMESVKMIVFTHLESFWNLLELIINCIIIPGCGWIFLKLGLKNKDLVNTTNMHATHLEKVNNNLKNVTKTIKRKLKKLDESNIKAKKFRPIRERKTKE